MFKKPKNASLKGDVHKKLDLTEKLSAQLDLVESEVSYLRENVESIAQTKRIKDKEIRDLKRKLEFKKKELATANSYIAMQK
jgi:hypothetical protein